MELRTRHKHLPLGKSVECSARGPAGGAGSPQSFLPLCVVYFYRERTTVVLEIQRNRSDGTWN